MYNFKKSLAAFAGLLALVGAVLLISPQTGHGQNPKEPVGPTKPVEVVNSPSNPVPVTGTVSVSNLGGSPLPVTGTVSVGNTVQTQAGIPPGAFSVVTQGGLISGADPEGTSYAITSLTVANIDSTRAQAHVSGEWGTTSDCKVFSGASQEAAGPSVSVPAGETVHLAFPQPFVISAKPGAAACLRTSIGGGDVRVTVVGYRF